MFKRTLLIVWACFTFLAVTAPAFCQEIVVYSARKEHLIRPLFDAYSRETGIKIKYTTGKAAVLLQRIKAEGKNTSSDPCNLLIASES